jgi:hypothetical protein
MREGCAHGTESHCQVRVNGTGVPGSYCGQGTVSATKSPRTATLRLGDGRRRLFDVLSQGK